MAPSCPAEKAAPARGSLAPSGALAARLDPIASTMLRAVSAYPAFCTSSAPRKPETLPSASRTIPPGPSRYSLPPTLIFPSSIAASFVLVLESLSVTRPGLAHAPLGFPRPRFGLIGFVLVFNQLALVALHVVCPPRGIGQSHGPGCPETDGHHFGGGERDSRPQPTGRPISLGAVGRHPLGEGPDQSVREVRRIVRDPRGLHDVTAHEAAEVAVEIRQHASRSYHVRRSVDRHRRIAHHLLLFQVAYGHRTSILAFHTLQDIPLAIDGHPAPNAMVGHGDRELVVPSFASGARAFLWNDRPRRAQYVQGGLDIRKAGQLGGLLAKAAEPLLPVDHEAAFRRKVGSP